MRHNAEVKAEAVEDDDLHSIFENLESGDRERGRKGSPASDFLSLFFVYIKHESKHIKPASIERSQRTRQCNYSSHRKTKPKVGDPQLSHSLYSFEATSTCRERLNPKLIFLFSGTKPQWVSVTPLCALRPVANRYSRLSF